jgi:NDP-sugar pyrophosphorylase family protein
MGTAGGLRLAKPMLDQTFIMIYGDNLFNFDISDMYNFHVDNNAMATIALTTVDDPYNYGVVSMKGNRIVRFSEKPVAGRAESNLISTGIYIINPEVIELVPKGRASLEKQVFTKLAKMGRLYGYTFHGQWFDVHTHEKYEKVLKEWKGV